jgi:hypothetical protein
MKLFARKADLEKVDTEGRTLFLARGDAPPFTDWIEVVPAERPASRLADIQHAVKLTAMCREVDQDWRAPEDRRWTATLWCNAVGECVVGYGPDEWTAVQAAHALKAAEENRRG